MKRYTSVCLFVRSTKKDFDHIHCRDKIQHQYLRACSSSGIVLWVETMASLPAAGGVAVPSRIGLFECPVCPVLLAASIPLTEL